MAAFSDGFEAENFDLWDATDKSAGCTLETTSDRANSGSISCRAIIDDAWEHAKMEKHDLGNWTQFNCRVYLNFDTFPGEDLWIRFFILYDAAWGAVAWAALFDDGGTYRIKTYNDITDTDHDSDAIVPSVDTWECYEIQVVEDDAAGRIDAWFEGVSVLDVNGIDTKSANPGLDQAYVGNLYNPDTVTLYIDDVYMDNTYIGPIAAPTAAHSRSSIAKQMEVFRMI